MKDNQTIAQFLKVKDFPFKIPFKIKDKNGEVTYYEDSNGFWCKRERDDKGNVTYYEDSDGYWYKRERDDKGNVTYYEDSNGYWEKCEYDDQGNLIYFEDSDDGTIVDDRAKPMIELTLEDIAKLKGVDVSQIRIKE